MNTISFPKLGLSFDIEPDIFSIGSYSLRWYGLIIATGFILAALYLFKRAKQFNTNPDELTNLLLWGLPISVICARLYFVINKWSEFKDNPIEILYIWQGGIAFYGSLIGAVLVIIIYTKKHKCDLLSILDLTSLCFMIGQFIGRWGNFVNAEAFGTTTTFPWGMSINGSSPVHPTFLYESLWNFIGFIILHFYSKKRKFRGEIFLSYLAWYGFGRMIIEGLRTDSLFIANTDIRISQLLAAISMIVALATMFIIKMSKSYTPIEKAYASFKHEQPAADQDQPVTEEHSEDNIDDTIKEEQNERTDN